jgi:hypothetical protein
MLKTAMKQATFSAIQNTIQAPKPVNTVMKP